MTRVDSIEQSRLFEESATVPRVLRPDNAPKARLSDPVTSHLAAKRAARSSKELVYAIRWWVSKQREPKSAFDIADALRGPQWQHDTVRSAVSRAGLHAVDTLGTSPAGSRCTRYVLRDGAA